MQGSVTPRHQVALASSRTTEMVRLRRRLQRWAVTCALAIAALLAPTKAAAICWWELVDIVVHVFVDDSGNTHILRFWQYELWCSGGGGGGGGDEPPPPPPPPPPQPECPAGCGQMNRTARVVPGQVCLECDCSPEAGSCTNCNEVGCACRFDGHSMDCCWISPCGGLGSEGVLYCSGHPPQFIGDCPEEGPPPPPLDPPAATARACPT